MNSVEKAQTENALVAGIIQTFRNPLNKGKVVAALEGADDKRMFENVFSENVVILSIIQSKAYFNAVFTKVNKLYSQRFMGICDADFDRLKGIDTGFDNLFFADLHDAENMGLNLDCGLDVANEYVPERFTDTIYSDICLLLSPVSYLKWYNSSTNSGICFDDIHVSTFYNGNAPLDFNAYYSAVAKREGNEGKVPVNEILSDYRDHNPIDNLGEITNGHDAIDCLYQMIHYAKNSNMPKKKFLRDFQSTFTFEKFKQTVLYRDILMWAEKVGAPNLMSA